MKNAKNPHGDLIFVGYTNGYQILYATEPHGGEGFFYSNTDGECSIPLYMLKTHQHRLQSTSNMSVTLETENPGLLEQSNND